MPQGVEMTNAEWKKLLEGVGVWTEYVDYRQGLRNAGVEDTISTSMAQAEFMKRLGIAGDPVEVAAGWDTPVEVLEELKGLPESAPGRDDEWACAQYALMSLGKKSEPLWKLVNLEEAPSLGAVTLLLLARENSREFLNAMMRKKGESKEGGMSMSELTEEKVAELETELVGIRQYLGGGEFSPVIHVPIEVPSGSPD